MVVEKEREKPTLDEDALDGDSPLFGRARDDLCDLDGDVLPLRNQVLQSPRTARARSRITDERSRTRQPKLSVSVRMKEAKSEKGKRTRRRS